MKNFGIVRTLAHLLSPLDQSDRRIRLRLSASTNQHPGSSHGGRVWGLEKRERKQNDRTLRLTNTHRDTIQQEKQKTKGKNNF